MAGASSFGLLGVPLSPLLFYLRIMFIKAFTIRCGTKNLGSKDEPSSYFLLIWL